MEVVEGWIAIGEGDELVRLDGDHMRCVDAPLLVEESGPGRGEGARAEPRNDMDDDIVKRSVGTGDDRLGQRVFALPVMAVRLRDPDLLAMGRLVGERE